jgi:hypothetical protein
VPRVQLRYLGKAALVFLADHGQARATSKSPHKIYDVARHTGRTTVATD